MALFCSVPFIISFSRLYLSQYCFVVPPYLSLSIFFLSYFSAPDSLFSFLVSFWAVSLDLFLSLTDCLVSFLLSLSSVLYSSFSIFYFSFYWFSNSSLCSFVSFSMQSISNEIWILFVSVSVSKLSNFSKMTSNKRIDHIIFYFTLVIIKDNYV